MALLSSIATSSVVCAAIVWMAFRNPVEWYPTTDTPALAVWGICAAVMTVVHYRDRGDLGHQASQPTATSTSEKGGRVA